YVAFLGEIAPRRNVSNLVRGWAEAVADLPQPPALVLAGPHGWDGEVDRAIAEVPSHLRVVRPGFLRPSHLRGYLGGAAGGAPEPVRGLRPGRARSDGLRSCRTHHRPALPSRGRRGRGGVLRARLHEHRGRAAAADRRRADPLGVFPARTRAGARVHLAGLRRG